MVTIDKLLTKEEVAQRLQVSEKTVGDWLRARTLVGVKVGRVWRITEEDLAAFIARNRQVEPPTVKAIVNKKLRPREEDK